MDEDKTQSLKNRPIQVAIVGRPNVGNSTLVNALLGDERMLTGPEVGLTRDAISSRWEWKGKGVHYEGTVPANSTATLTLPDKAENVRVVELAAGRYEFIVK